jgi:hypothetical protein
MLYFNAFLTGALTGQYNLTGVPVRAALINEAVDTPVASDATMADINVSAVLGDVSLQNVTLVNGVLDANDITFVDVGTGSQTANGVLLYSQTGAPTNTHRLIAYFQVGDVTGLPAANLNVSDVSVVWHPTGILRLAGVS